MINNNDTMIIVLGSFIYFNNNKTLSAQNVWKISTQDWREIYIIMNSMTFLYVSLFQTLVIPKHIKN